MTSSNLINLLLGLAFVAYLCVRQLTWLPIILGAAGILSIAGQSTSVRAIDVAILGLSALFALAPGALMGVYRPVPAIAGRPTRGGDLHRVAWRRHLVRRHRGPRGARRHQLPDGR